MKTNPPIGKTQQLNFTVQPQHTIDFADQTLPPILSTPHLIWHLEHAARNAILPHLQPHQTTVGTHIQLQHLAPAPLNAQIQCQAKIIHRDQTTYSFQLHATHQNKPIARGTHKLRIIPKKHITQTLQNQQKNQP